ncbi:MAG: invasion associated locus B family protein [Oceanospirillaceae bacterium]|nr:invasion associated locus B family protein [Oceanospirillaceae bacterium]
MKYLYFQMLLISTLLLSAEASLAASIEGKQYKDWRIDCQQANGREFCFVSQPLIAKSNGVIMVTTVDIVQHSTLPVVTFRLSTMLDATKEIQFKIDKNQPIGLKAKCNEKECIVNFLLDKRMLNEFKRGSRGVLAFIAKDTNKPKYFPLSLSGFTKAYNRLRKG